MSKGFNKILDFMKLNDNEYDDDYDEYDDEIDDEVDDIPEEPVKKKSAASKTTSRFKKTATKVNDDFDDFDDIDDEVSEKRKTRSTTTRKTSSFGRNSNIVPMRQISSRSMEVCVSKPVDFNTCQEISDIILSGRAAIINFDAVTTQEAQRIIDFVSGSCYAINGSAKQISDSIVIVTPEDIDITGDLQEMVSSNVDIPAFGYSEEDE